MISNLDNKYIIFKIRDMKKYEVTFYYHTNCTVEVEAENEEEALEIAEKQSR